MSDRYAEKRLDLPPSYVHFIEKIYGWEGDLGDDFNFAYVRLWKKESIQEYWNIYEMGQYLDDHWFPIGSNGGGEMLCFDLRSEDDGVFYIPYIGMSGDEAVLKYETFEIIARIANMDRAT